jgi:hypothetical protein
MQTVGVIDAIFQGRKLPLEKGAKFNPGGFKNNPVIAGRQVFRSQEVVASMLDGVTVLPKGTKLGDLLPDGEGELQVICDTGQVFVVPDAFRTEVPDVTGGDGGKIPVKIAGSPATEIE